MKVLSQETNLQSDTTVDNATVVRTYNNSESATTVIKKDSDGFTVGSLSISPKKVTYLEKKYNDTLIADSTVKVSKIAYSPALQFANWLEGGGAPSYYTISRSEVYGFINDDTNTDGIFSETLTNCATVPVSGKRFYMINMSYRLTGSGSYNNYEDFFKPSGQGGNATITLAGHTPTYQACAKTSYNATALYTGTADLNTSGSDANITFSFNNSGNSDAAGGYALAIWIFDYVEEADFNTQVISSLNNINTAGPVNVAPGGTGTGWTASFKFVTGVASNPPNNDNPSWAHGSGESDTNYILLQEGDNGTNEVTETMDAFDQNNGNLSNITGTMTMDNNSYASNGLGVLAVHARFKPAQQ